MLLEITLVLAMLGGGNPAPQATPQSELAAAISDYNAMPASEAKYARYLTLYAADRPEVEKTLFFWVNSLSNQRVLKLPIKLSDTLYRVDLRDYGWSLESWAAVAAEDPYYNGAYGNLIVRGDWFIVQTSDGTRSPSYYRLLYGLGKEPKNADEFRKFWAADVNLARQQGAEVGAVVDTDDSIVALHNRIIAQIRTVNGWYWQSFDTNADSGKKNALENLHVGFQFDAQEHIISLRNGLHAYLLSDAKGARLEFADPAIAKDRTGHKRATVDNPISCVRCHGRSDGVIPPGNKLLDLLNNGGLATSNDKTLQQKLEAFYLTDNGQDMRDAQRNYAAQIMYLTGWTGRVNTEKFERMVRWYDQKVTLDQAAIELGVSKERLVKAAETLVLVGKDDRNGQLSSLVRLGSCSRTIWESAVFKKTQALLTVAK